MPEAMGITNIRAHTRQSWDIPILVMPMTKGITQRQNWQFTIIIIIIIIIFIFLCDTW